MTSRTIVTITDDLTGGDADRTLRFALGPTLYEIDLNETNAEALQAALAPYIAAARRVGRIPGGNSATTLYRPARAITNPPSTPPGDSDALSAARQRNGAIRAWAQSNGVEIADRGRIPTTVVEQYEAAQAAPTPTVPSQKKAPRTVAAAEFSGTRSRTRRRTAQAG